MPSMTGEDKRGDAAGERLGRDGWTLHLRRVSFRLPAEAREIGRTARLGPRSRQTRAAKGLAADHGADLVAVDVDVARPDGARDLVDPRVDPRVQPEGQAVARGIDIRDDVVEPLAPEGRDVQDRAEDLALQIRDAVDADRARADENAPPTGPRPGAGGGPRPAPRRCSRSSTVCAAASITGPTSVARSHGSPILSSSIAPKSIFMKPSAISSCR